MITQDHYSQLERFGIDKAEADSQYNLLTSGVHFMQLDRAANLGDGILPLTEEEADSYVHYYEEQHEKINIKKFVPASGAASRMFKDLIVLATEGKSSEATDKLFNSVDKLAFSSLLPKNASKQELAAFILQKLGYQKTPKGLIPFHAYELGARTPFEEHWVEGCKYAHVNGIADIHFTVSEEHHSAFQELFSSKSEHVEKDYGVQLKVSYSYQKKQTDTIAIDNEGTVVTNEDGSVLLRPGGHGALIQNLDSLNADLVFVKNIDNITHENHLAPTVRYKKALAGILLELKDNVFDQLQSIEEGAANIEELEKLGTQLMVQTPDSYAKASMVEKIDFWKAKLNRPIRVCGMVKNEGEPGGGPFWVNSQSGISLQIVESAQIDRANQEQEAILQNSTHFNPVDLVCYTKDYKGKPFNLNEFVDESAAFITAKSFNGKDITVLERPGLWNGAMAYWNTIFVEVPIATFNPVKTVNDLLKPAHQQ